MDRFNKTFRLTKLTFLFSGIDIENNKPRSWYTFMNYIFYLNLVWLYTDVLGEFFWLIQGIQNDKSFVELSLIAPCATICLLATAKSAPIFYSRVIIANVFAKLRQIHPTFADDEYIGEGKAETVYYQDVEEEHRPKDTGSDIEKKIVNDTMNFLNTVAIIVACFYGLVTVVFIILPAIVMSYEYYKEGEYKLLLPFLIKYFFDPYTNMIIYPLVYFHQAWSTFIVAFNVFASDSFLSAFCSCISMHFQILCHRFEHVVVSSNAGTRERLTALIKRHQELIQLVNQVEGVCSKGILFNIVTSSVLICLSGFNVTFLDDTGLVFAFFTFLLMSMSQIAFLCLFGDMLVRSSTKVSEAIYKCRWYDADRGIKQIVYLIMIRSQKPCKLTAAKFADLNLTAFTTILSRSWSYFALLSTVYK